MKKTVLLLLIALSIISCSNDDAILQSNPSAQNTLVKRLATNENVKLLSAWTSYSELYGYSSYYRRFKVEVKNLSYNKIVVISHKMADGSWKDFSLKYITSTNNNTEIWGADITINNSYYVGDTPSLLFANEFVIRYEVNGQKYWDNNGNKNFKMGILEGTYLRPDLNLSVDTLYSTIYNQYSATSNTFAVSVDIRNLNPSKQVTVVYTTDNWNTTKRASLSYIQWLTVGARQVLISPNIYGIERWETSFDIPLTVNTIQYAVVYKVNGIEYWDNNFGKNYTATKHI